MIELMVVISIIAILIALLLPVLRTTRESAKAMQCSAQIKQITFAMMVYADNNDDTVPPDLYLNPVTNQTSPWSYFLYSELNFNPSSDFYKNKVFWCPVLEQWKSTSYAMNRRAGSVRIADVKRVCDAPLLADSISIGTAFSMSLDHPGGSYYRWLEFRHTKAANISYFDGHVKLEQDDPKWDLVVTWTVVD